MKTLIYKDERLQAEKIIKTNTDIVGYNGNKVEFAFRGIGDFSLFSLEDGQDWDLPDDVVETNYLLDLDFRLSKLELGL